MWTEAQNLAIVQTELDAVFFQNFEYDNGFPSIATAQTAAIFKPMTIDRAAYIEDDPSLHISRDSRATCRHFSSLRMAPRHRRLLCKRQGRQHVGRGSTEFPLE